MANEGQVLDQPQVSTEIPQALKEQMSIALNGYIPQDSPLNVPITNPAQADTPQAAPSTTTTPEPTPPPISFDVIKEKFQYESPEAAIKEIEELRLLKANPVSAPLKLEGDSERLYKAIASGDRVQVLDILNKQAQIERLTALDVTKDTAAEIVKTGMQLKYSDLTPAEIEYKFKKQFAVPPKPVQQDIDTDEEYQFKVDAWQEQVNDRQMELLIEAKLAKPEIANAKSKIELPKIEQPSDESYIKYQQMLDSEAKMDAETKDAYKKFTPAMLETKIDYNDEANKINFQYQFTPDVDTFQKAVDIVSDMDKYYELFYNSDGSPNRQKYFEFVYKGLNADKMITEAIKQGANARVKSLLPDNQNNGGVRYLPQDQTISELDKQMEQAGIKRRVG